MKLIMLFVISLLAQITGSLNATEIRILAECEKFLTTENYSLPVEAIFSNATFLFDEAYYLGYCIGLSYRDGFIDATANKTN